VKGMIDRNNFLKNNNKNNNYTLDENSFVNKLDNLEYKPNYNNLLSSTANRGDFDNSEIEWL
jgi:hypothetical protein